MLKGSMVAMVTPFRNGSIDESALRQLIDFQIENGTDAIVPCGTTGESATLSYEEHERVVEITIEAVGGRVPVIAGSGSNSTSETIMLTREAEKAGADAALLISPYYNKPTQEGLYQHYKGVAEAVNIPIILYNVPGRTGTNMLPETVARLAEIENIVGVKEATGDLRQISDLIGLCPEGFSVISGDDFTTFSLLGLGGKGAISVTANVIPGDVASMIDCFEEGNMNEARRLHYRMMPVNRSMFLETNPIPAKTALAMMGRIAEGIRLPLTPMADRNREKLGKTLKEYGLI
ncbi:MAG: 4-hydroxy-tetrahydrodipicolinate synthase [Thermodesulfobacteriota bacterium]